MSAKKHNPSKKELLLELENIRDLLGEATPVSDPSIPQPENPSLTFPDTDEEGLTSIPKLTNEVKVNEAQTDDAEDKRDGRAQVTKKEQKNSEDSTTDEQALTEQPKEIEAESTPAPLPETVKEPAAVEEASASEAAEAPAKKNADNPFLPPHIRERLGQNKQQELVEELSLLGESLERSRKQISRSNTSEMSNLAATETKREPASLSPSDAEHLVDELVQKYLPKIEKELRKQLRAKLQLDS